MPVTDQTPVDSSTGNGVTTVFPYTFKILAEADILVTVDGVTKTLTTDYSVSGVGNDAGGNVTFVAAPANGTTVVRTRDMGYERTTDYQDNGDLPASTLDDDIDRTVMLVQQLRAALLRSVKLPVGTTVEQVLTESATARALKLMGFDSSGNITTYAAADVDITAVSAFVATLLDDTSASNFLTTLGVSNYIKTLLDDATATAARQTLHVGGKAQDFRLSLTSGVPVTVADVTGAGTIYAVPRTGNQISLYDGAEWVVRSSAEFSLALSALTSGKPYDVFCYDNSGTPTLEFLAWTNDTTRATALAYQDGVLVKSGGATRRYLGTFYTTGTATTEDSAANRYLWNYYHRTDRQMVRNEATATWTYTTNTWRQANAATANQLNFVIGVAEDMVYAHAAGAARNSTAQQVAYVGIGLDSTTVNSATLMPLASIFSSATHYVAVNAEYFGMPAAGRHYLAWLEIDVTATNTTTWAGSQDSAKSGIHGMVRG